MRILILGAGGVGGYFGARMHGAGGDVTFLARPTRAESLKNNGLQVLSPAGDIHIVPKIVTAPELSGDVFDVIMLSCKAYDLDSAISPAIGDGTLVLPLLNGIAHLDLLDSRFGRERVLGGVAHIGVTMTPEGEIRHLNTLHRLIVGLRGAAFTKQAGELAERLFGIGVDFAVSENIEQDMWDKFIFLSTLAAATCAMRAPVGDILHTLSGKAFICGLMEECVSVATARHHAPNPQQLTEYRNLLTDPQSGMTSSMLRDIERGAKTEADHIIGDMVSRADQAAIDAPLLKLAYSHLQAYELRNARLVVSD